MLRVHLGSQHKALCSTLSPPPTLLSHFPGHLSLTLDSSLTHLVALNSAFATIFQHIWDR